MNPYWMMLFPVTWYAMPKKPTFWLHCLSLQREFPACLRVSSYIFWAGTSSNSISLHHSAKNLDATVRCH